MKTFKTEAILGILKHIVARGREYHSRWMVA